jgi:hypothetical protein
VVRRDGLRTVSRPLFAVQECSTERSAAWREGREELPKGRFSLRTEVQMRVDNEREPPVFTRGGV